MSWYWWLGIAAALLVAGGIMFFHPKEPASDSGLPVVTMRIGSLSFQLEVARRESELSRGLMFRQSMAADRGMIFVFDGEEERGFYMKNTYIPLDILFLDARGRVVSIHQMQPRDLATTPSLYPAQYAIELNQGMAAKAGVKVGDELVIPEGARR
jgi:uncharacterized membrane protein (UPF0127 family)